MRERVIRAFEERFNEPPAFVVRAPGRVNLIGEHTDYNDGFCLPMAIDRALWIALRPRPDQRVCVEALDMGESITFDLGALSPGPAGWDQYVTGVAWALQRNGYELSGWEGMMSGDIPIGSGLSSSAALELAVARAFAAVSGFAWEARRMVQVAQQTENEWLGLRTGIMDQLICATGVEGQALLMDCRSLSLEPVPLPSGAVVVVMDTRTPRGLVHSAYNERRAECEQAARRLGVASLRDASRADLERPGDPLAPVLLQRARHVITENERTLLAAAAMRADDAAELGRLMNASHDSLRDDYEVTSATLDTMVAAARRQQGCWGARMTGAGFGGCAIALVAEPDVAAFINNVFQAYEQATGLTPDIFACRPAAGVGLIGLGETGSAR
ncbi:MAG: galactokinase [Candidatus Promineofilum sp.]|nr:galactokinase [Promineifilum sp.]